MFCVSGFVLQGSLLAEAALIQREIWTVWEQNTLTPTTTCLITPTATVTTPSKRAVRYLNISDYRVKKLMKMILSSFIDAVFSFSMVYWFGSLSLRNRNRLKRVGLLLLPEWKRLPSGWKFSLWICAANRSSLSFARAVIMFLFALYSCLWCLLLVLC